MSYKITIHEKPMKEDLKVLSDGFKTMDRELFPDKSWVRDIAFFLRDENGLVVGGVSGNYGAFGWLYVDALWLRDSDRGRGYGTELMDLIETEAKKHGCENAYLSTMSYQAPGFYKKRGYTVFGELDNFPDEQSRIFLRKKLL